MLRWIEYKKKILYRSQQYPEEQVGPLDLRMTYLVVTFKRQSA